MRPLSDTELEEFFNGKKELLTRQHEFDQENCNWLPYDQSYEVDMDEIDFDMWHHINT
jgi:hypothetical protein